MPALDTQSELNLVRKQYDDLCCRMDEILSQTMERSNRIVMETEIGSLIMNQVFNAAHDGIWAIDKNHRVIRVNRRLLDFLGLPPEAVVGRMCHEVLMGACSGGGKCPMERILSGEETVQQERNLMSKAGRSVPFLVAFTPLSDFDQRTIGIVETFTDITGRKHVEDRLQAVNRELERLAAEDPLTGLFNRRQFDERLKAEWSRLSLAHRPMSLLMCDVDYFKDFNDHYGHQAGDACLRSVAAVIRKCARHPRHSSARYGGEEFVIVMPEIEAADALQVAETIRRELTEMLIPHCCSSAAPYVTVSSGVATVFPSSDVHPRTLVEMADNALYRAKQRGRNCIEVFEGDCRVAQRAHQQQGGR